MLIIWINIFFVFSTILRNLKSILEQKLWKDYKIFQKIKLKQI